MQCRIARLQRVISLVLFMLVGAPGCLLIGGCGSGDRYDSGIHVTVSPAVASLLPGEQTSFTATVIGTSNQQVRWSLANITRGSITTEGVFTAPAEIGLYSIVAISVADPSKRATAIVNVVATKANWTVLVYMAADNDLEGQAIADLNEMEMIGSSDSVRVLVQLDRSAGYDTSNGNLSGARRLEVAKDNDQAKISSTEILSLGETDMGDPATLRAFLQWGQQYAPAQHYLLIIWNHGNGWNPISDAPALAQQRAIAMDDSAKSAIRIHELPLAFSGVSSVDIVAMDACLMAMLEVAYELRGSTSYLVASQEEEPADGYRYDLLLDYISSLGGMSATPEQLAGNIAEIAFENWSGCDYATCSAIRIEQMNAVANKLNALASKLNEASNNQAEINSARADTRAFGYNARQTNIKDLVQFASFLSTYSSNLKPECDALISVVNEAVISNYHAAGRSQAHGLSIYLPSAGAFSDQTLSSYALLSLSRETVWDTWLRE